MTKRYFKIVRGGHYTFDHQVVGGTFVADQVYPHAVSLVIDVPHGRYTKGVVWAFPNAHVEEVFKNGQETKRRKNIRAPKQKPPAPKQRTLSIAYASSSKYHLKNVKSVIVDTRSDELKVSYTEDRKGTEFRINFTVPFSELTAIHFEDKLAKVSVGYFFLAGKLKTRVEHFSETAKVSQH